jgi:hypothetical protein
VIANSSLSIATFITAINTHFALKTTRTKRKNNVVVLIPRWVESYVLETKRLVEQVGAFHARVSPPLWQAYPRRASTTLKFSAESKSYLQHTGIGRAAHVVAFSCAQIPLSAKYRKETGNTVVLRSEKSSSPRDPFSRSKRE